MADQTKTKEQKIKQLEQLIHTVHGDEDDTAEHWDFRKVYAVVHCLGEPIWEELIGQIQDDATEPQHLSDVQLSAIEYDDEGWLRDRADIDDYCVDVHSLVQLLGKLRKRLGDNPENCKVLWDPMEDQHYLAEVRDITNEELNTAIEGMAEMVEETQQNRENRTRRKAEMEKERNERRVKESLLHVAARIGFEDALRLLTASVDDG